MLTIFVYIYISFHLSIIYLSRKVQCQDLLIVYLPHRFSRGTVLFFLLQKNSIRVKIDVSFFPI